jgi:hypothetical protein
MTMRIKNVIVRVYGAAVCFLGLHFVPKNWAMQSDADGTVIVAGGICPRCGEIKEDRPLCNVWEMEIPCHLPENLAGLCRGSIGLPPGFVYVGSPGLLKSAWNICRKERGWSAERFAEAAQTCGLTGEN